MIMGDELNVANIDFEQHPQKGDKFLYLILFKTLKKSLTSPQPDVYFQGVWIKTSVAPQASNFYEGGRSNGE